LAIVLIIVFGKVVLTAVFVIAVICTIILSAATLCFVIFMVIGGIWSLVYGISREIICFLAKKCRLRQ
jgi:hypothetical protein